MGSWAAPWPLFLCGCVCVTHSRQSNVFHHVIILSHTEPNDPELVEFTRIWTWQFLSRMYLVTHMFFVREKWKTDTDGVKEKRGEKSIDVRHWSLELSKEECDASPALIQLWPGRSDPDECWQIGKGWCHCLHAVPWDLASLPVSQSVRTFRKS